MRPQKFTIAAEHPIARALRLGREFRQALIDAGPVCSEYGAAFCAREADPVHSMVQDVIDTFDCALQDDEPPVHDETECRHQAREYRAAIGL